MNKLFKTKVIISKIGILLVSLCISIGLIQYQILDVDAASPFTLSYTDQNIPIIDGNASGRTWNATVSGNGSYTGSLVIFTKQRSTTSQENTYSYEFKEKKPVPGINIDQQTYYNNENQERIGCGIRITNKTATEIQDYLNDVLYIYCLGLANGYTELPISSMNLRDNEYVEQVKVTYNADTGSNNGSGTVKVNGEALLDKGSVDVDKNTEVTITMIPESGSYVDGISINGVLKERYSGQGEKTYKISNITDHTTITPSFSLVGKTPEEGDGIRNQGNLAWVDDRTQLSYKEALEFNYNAKVTDFILNSNFGKSWTYGVDPLDDPKMFMSAQFENGESIKIGKSETEPESMEKLGGTQPVEGMELSTGITPDQVLPGEFTQKVTADYYTAKSICPNHWYHVFGVEYHKDGMTREIVIAKDTLSLTLGNQFTYGDQIKPELIPASKDIAGSRATIDEQKVQYQYVGIDGTTYDSSTAPTMPGKYKVIVKYEGDEYIQAYDDSSALTKEFTINKSTPSDNEVKIPTVTPHAEHLDLTNLVDGQLYSINGTEWYTKDEIMAKNPFTNLDQNKAYTVQTKIAETETSNESVIKQVTATTLVKLSGKVEGRDLPATLTFTSNGKNYEVITDDNGNYSLEVPAGKYTMKADGENGDETYESKNSIDVKENTVVPTINMERTQQGQDKDHANEFVKKHLTDKNNEIIKEVNRSTVDMILGGETEFNNLSSDAQKYVNDQLIDAQPNTYQKMLEEAKAYVKDNASQFVKDNLTDKEGHVITSVSKDTIDAILAAEDKYNALSQSEKDEINEQLSTAAGKPISYEEMLEAAHKLAKDNATQFVKDNLTDKEGHVITSVSEDTMDAILAAEDKYNALSQSEKDEINAQLSEAAGKPVTYEEMLKEAKDILDETTDSFIKDHMTNKDGIITKVNAATLDNILGGEKDFNALTDAQKAEVNAKLKDAGATQTYEEMLEAAHKLAKDNATQFVKDNLTDKEGHVITSVSKDTMDAILTAEDKYNALSQSEKDEINAQLSAAAGKAITYEEMLALAKNQVSQSAAEFIKKYVSDKDGNIYKSANKSNYSQILSGEDAWDKLSQSEKNAINDILKANGGKTYEELLELANLVKKSVETGDETNVMPLYMLVLSSLLGGYIAIKKRKEA